MRLLGMLDSGLPANQIKEFNEWVLSIGDGTAKGSSRVMMETQWIENAK